MARRADQSVAREEKSQGRRRSELDRADGQHVVERRVRKPVRLGDSLVGQLALDHVHTLGERQVVCDRRAEAQVAFVSALVDVIGTAPGMFATQ